MSSSAPPAAVSCVSTCSRSSISRTTACSAFEALVRWEHPQHGLVPPGVFIPLAEDSGIIGEIGTWVLRESARWAAQIHPGVYLSVNLSTRQLEDPLIGETVREALEEFERAAGPPDAGDHRERAPRRRRPSSSTAWRRCARPAPGSRSTTSAPATRR